MSQPQPPTPPSPEYRVQVGTGGVKVTKLDTDANAALTQQAQLLKTRIEALTKEIEPMPLDLSVQAERNNTLVIWLAAIVCIGLPISVAIARSIWKRTTARGLPPAPAEDARRLERVEQAVDAIAIEMERMSEGQRYVTKLLAAGADRLGVDGAGGGLQENQETPPTRVAQR